MAPRLARVSTTEASQAISASVATLRANHHAAGWNQSRHRTQSANAALSRSPSRMCANSCRNTERRVCRDQRRQLVGMTTLGEKNPAVTGTTTSFDSRSRPVKGLDLRTRHINRSRPTSCLPATADTPTSQARNSSAPIVTLPTVT